MCVPIPVDMQGLLSQDPFMKSCIVAHECDGRIEWHHAMTYQGRRVTEIYAIVPLCHKHHSEMTRSTAVLSRMNIRARIAHFKAKEQFLKDYPKSDLFR